jgi:hypothetical protein
MGADWSRGRIGQRQRSESYLWMLALTTNNRRRAPALDGRRNNKKDAWKT